MLRMETATVPLETGLFELGMDSLMSVELKRRLERGAGRALPSTLTFNYPNVVALAGFLDSELRGAVETSAATKQVEASPPVQTSAAEGPSTDLDTLSEEELEARLLARLERHR